MCVPELRSRDPIGVPGVDFATVDRQRLGLDHEPAQAVRGLGVELAVQETDLVALVVVGHATKRVGLHDPCQLGRGAHDHGHVEPEPLRDQRG